jgi:DNA-binding transcriptional MerR regulator
MKTYTISALAREFATTNRALRFYEDKGLVTPSRRGKGLTSERIYTEEDRARVALICRCRECDLSILAIAQILRCEGAVRDEALRIALNAQAERASTLALRATAWASELERKAA